MCACILPQGYHFPKGAYVGKFTSVHTCTHIVCKHTYINTNTHTHIILCTSMCTIHTCTQAHTYAHVYTHAHTHFILCTSMCTIHTCTQAHTHFILCTSMCTIHTCTQAHTYAHVYTHAHTHAHEHTYISVIEYEGEIPADKREAVIQELNAESERLIKVGGPCSIV